MEWKFFFVVVISVLMAIGTMYGYKVAKRNDERAYNEYRDAIGFAFGMSFPLSKADEYSKTVKTWSIEQMATLADVIAKAGANDPEKCKEWLAGVEEGLTKDDPDINLTFFGNVAQMILHCPEPYSSGYRKVLEQIMALPIKNH